MKWKALRKDCFHEDAMAGGIEVARQLRQMAALAGGTPHGVVISVIFLREMAEKLDPDCWRDRHPRDDAGYRPLDDEDEDRGRGIVFGFEAIGRHFLPISRRVKCEFY